MSLQEILAEINKIEASITNGYGTEEHRTSNGFVLRIRHELGSIEKQELVVALVSLYKMYIKGTVGQLEALESKSNKRAA